MGTLNCGECLMDRVEIVELLPDGKCPCCGVDYGKPIGNETMPPVESSERLTREVERESKRR